MANQIETPKLNAHTVIGAKATEQAVGKFVMFVLLQPGDSADDASSNRQAHVYSQIVRRR